MHGPDPQLPPRDAPHTSKSHQAAHLKNQACSGSQRRQRPSHCTVLPSPSRTRRNRSPCPRSHRGRRGHYSELQRRDAHARSLTCQSKQDRRTHTSLRLAWRHRRSTRKNGMVDDELDLEGRDEQKIAHHGNRRKADKIANDTRSVTGVTEGEIDDHFGWNQKERKKTSPPLSWPQREAEKSPCGNDALIVQKRSAGKHMAEGGIPLMLSSTCW